jgi:hypothetical protein
MACLVFTHRQLFENRNVHDIEYAASNIKIEGARYPESAERMTGR